MDKPRADSLITEFLPKIYGFSVKKCYYYEEAEELSSMITEAVYSSLLRAKEIANIEGYIWRISENTYSKFVAAKKKRNDAYLEETAEIPFLPFDEYCFNEEDREQLRRLRREIAFLTEKRRRIIYLFYYRNKSVAFISKETGLPEGTVKWHLSKARDKLKEGFSMERKTGKLGISPVRSAGCGHNGSPVYGARPEDIIRDTLDLNIVYSVYHSPKNKEEIAEELGITPVFIEEKIDWFEKNGFMTKTKGDRYTTYVEFSPETYSAEEYENQLKLQLQIAEELAESYVPLVREAVKDVKEVYIPGGNRELFEAAAVFYGLANRCRIETHKDLSQYYIEPAAGGSYIAYMIIEQERTDPDYKPTLEYVDYSACGDMNRWSVKYPSVYSWSIDTRYDSRAGWYDNNHESDYEYVYEYICGQLPDNAVNSNKIKRLKERGFLGEDGRINIMIVKGDRDDLFARIPEPSEEIKDKYADRILEYAANEAKKHPQHMRDLVVTESTEGFISKITALMTMDILYKNGTFRPLNETERVTSNLLMFCDRLPE
ncbi:MAG: sigma-70 family RNA polymerase sigma factor [Bacteroides sp.]|nr:sigma-70 family RNA polymerase sigma factor [Bacteroides sp.]